MPSSRQSKVEIKSVPLEIFKYSLTQVVSERMLDLFAIPAKVDISEHVNFMADDMLVRVRQDILGSKLEDVHISYPATLWDAIKDRFFPQWMLKRRPVKYKHHDIVVRELHPRLSLPEEYHVLNMDRREWVGD